MNLQRSKINKLKILVIGEVCIDRYIQGSVTRISPEAPVQIVEYKGKEDRLGMAANVALNLKSLGAQVSLASVIGSDKASRTLVKMLNQHGLSSSLIMKEDGRKTIIKKRIVSGQQHLLRIDYENKPKVSKDLWFLFMYQLLEQILKHDAVVIEDYGKGLFDQRLQGIIAYCNENKVPVFVDPHKSSNLKWYKDCTLIKLNMDEAVHFTKECFIDRITASINAKVGCKTIVVTNGASGMVGMARGGIKANVEGIKVVPIDSTGAGDIVISVLTVSMLLGYDLKTSMRLANKYAAKSVSKFGTVVV